MKRQYFGDELDFLKYAFLRQLTQTTGARVGIVWMLTPDDDTDHGKRRRYLDAPETWRAIDAELFDLLQEPTVRVNAPESVLMGSILPGSHVVVDEMPAAGDGRAAYLARALDALSAADLVFFDPDTGLAPASTARTSVGTAHVHLNELIPFYRAGKSLVVFQHYPRISRPSFREKTAERLRSALEAESVALLAHSHGFFSFVPASDGSSPFTDLSGLNAWASKRRMTLSIYGSGGTETAALVATGAEAMGPEEIDGVGGTTWERAVAGVQSRAETVQRAAAEAGEKLQVQLLEWIDEGISLAIESTDPPPDGVTAKEIILSYENKNAAISGGLNLIPGPAGLLAILPEIGFVLKNQVQMVVELAQLRGRRDLLSREVVMALLSASSGALAAGVLSIQGQRILAKRASLRAMQAAAKLLGARVTQQVIRSGIAKWIPIAGALAMAVWTKIWTRRIGRNADRVFTSGEWIVTPQPVPEPGGERAARISKLRIEALLALAWSDGALAPAERQWFDAMVAEAPLEPRDRKRLLTALEQRPAIPGDLGELKEHRAAAEELMVDLLALAQRDGDIRPHEREFIEHARVQMGLDPEEFSIPQEDIAPAKVVS